MAESLFDVVPEITKDEAFFAKAQFDADPHPKKIFLSIGAYRDENGKPYVLKVVKKAEEAYQKDLLEGRENKEYDTLDGFKPFRDASVKLLLGEDCPPLDHIASAVCLSGSGAICTAANFLKKILPLSTSVFVSNATWALHHPIFDLAGYTAMKKYRYYDSTSHTLDFVGMVEDLKAAPEKSIVILHLCGHNPTGVDPTHDQWQKLSDLCKEKKFHVIIDAAYQGYATGDLNRDAFGARLFLRNGNEFITCQSYAKNMGLYGDRLGCLSVTCRNPSAAGRVHAMLKDIIIRRTISSPPRRAARVAHLILTDATLRREWEEELKQMSGRIIKMREALFNELQRLQTPGKWNHIVDQIGMFSYLGLSSEQCQKLISDHHIYLLLSGRISMAGLNESNVTWLAEAIDDVVRSSVKPN